MENKDDINKKITEEKKTGIEQRKQAIIDLVMRQTNYTKEEAEEKLEECKYNYLQVIKFYMNPDSKISTEEPVTVNKSKNQMIYGEIRNFMDGVNKQYLYRKRRKEVLEKKKELFISKLKEEHERRLQEKK
jgi:hypothetical protein